MDAKTARIHRKLDEMIAADSPDKYAHALAAMLNEVSEDCHGAALTVEHAWQDADAGRPWTRIAKLVEGLERKLTREYARPERSQ